MKVEVSRPLTLCPECRGHREVVDKPHGPYIRLTEEQWALKPELNHDREKVSTLNAKQLKIAENAGHFTGEKAEHLAADMGMTVNQYKSYMHRKMVLSEKRNRYYTKKDFR